MARYLLLLFLLGAAQGRTFLQQVPGNYSYVHGSPSCPRQLYVDRVGRMNFDSGCQTEAMEIMEWKDTEGNALTQHFVDHKQYKTVTTKDYGRFMIGVFDSPVSCGQLKLKAKSVANFFTPEHNSSLDFYKVFNAPAKPSRPGHGDSHGTGHGDAGHSEAAHGDTAHADGAHSAPKKADGHGSEGHEGGEHGEHGDLVRQIVVRQAHDAHGDNHVAGPSMGKIKPEATPAMTLEPSAVPALFDIHPRHTPSVVIHVKSDTVEHAVSKEPVHMHKQEPVHGHKKEPVHEHKKEPTHGHKKEPAHGHKKEPAHGHKKEPAHGHKKEPVHKEEPAHKEPAGHAPEGHGTNKKMVHGEQHKLTHKDGNEEEEEEEEEEEKEEEEKEEEEEGHSTGHAAHGTHSRSSPETHHEPVTAHKNAPHKAHGTHEESSAHAEHGVGKAAAHGNGHGASKEAHKKEHKEEHKDAAHAEHGAKKSADHGHGHGTHNVEHKEAGISEHGAKKTADHGHGNGNGAHKETHKKEHKEAGHAEHGAKKAADHGHGAESEKTHGSQHGNAHATTGTKAAHRGTEAHSGHDHQTAGAHDKTSDGAHGGTEAHSGHNQSPTGAHEKTAHGAHEKTAHGAHGGTDGHSEHADASHGSHNKIAHGGTEAHAGHDHSGHDKTPHGDTGAHTEADHSSHAGHSESHNTTTHGSHGGADSHSAHGEADPHGTTGLEHSSHDIAGHGNETHGSHNETGHASHNDSVHGTSHEEPEASSTPQPVVQAQIGLTTPGNTYQVSRGLHYVALEDQCLYVQSKPMACFPGTSTVQLKSGRRIAMGELQTGDEVLVGDGKYSQVFMWTHRDRYARAARYYQVTASSGKSIVAAAGHYLYTERDGLKPIEEVNTEDALMINNSWEKVVQVARNFEVGGLYNPQTISGDIVVDGVLASTYTTAVQPLMSHALLAPFRSLYYGVLRIIGGTRTDGVGVSVGRIQF